ncbi:MAG: hypothetical protein IRZ11_08080 [Clostridia bacterium]|nr:hypothetical protein [Clostridia bacterium]
MAGVAWSTVGSAARAWPAEVRPEAPEPPARPGRRHRRRSLPEVRRKVEAARAFRRFLATAACLALVLVAFATVVASAQAVVREGARVEQLKSELAAAEAERDRLAIAVGAALSPRSVATKAASEMGMSAPALEERVALQPVPAKEAAARPATRTAEVALAPRPAPEATLWAALGDWLGSWFRSGSVEARDASR